MIRLFDDIQIKFRENDLLINKRNGKVILYNKEKKRHVKLSEEVYEYTRLAEKNNWKVRELIDCFKKDEDKKYIESILNIMVKNEVLMGIYSTKKTLKTCIFLLQIDVILVVITAFQVVVLKKKIIWILV